MNRRFLSRLTAISLPVICLVCQAFAIDAVSVGAQGLAPLPRPLYFTENRGQWDERVLFKADAAGGLTWFIERDGFTVLFSKPDTTWRADFQSALTGWKPVLPARERTESPPSKNHALKFKFIQSQNPSVFASPDYSGRSNLYSVGEIASLRSQRRPNSWLQSPDLPSTSTSTLTSSRLSWNNNYFLGNDPAKWAPNCGNFGEVTQHDVWKGIDVEWYESSGHVEFDFVVKPGGDPSQVGLRVDGLTGEMEVTGDGEELLLPTSLGTLRFTLPEAYQAGDGSKSDPVPAHFSVTGANRLGLALPEGYDAGKKLIVDPLVYSTYLGGNGDDYACAIVSDVGGGVTVAGYTESEDFPITERPFDWSFNGGDYDIFIAELSRDGMELLYCTYLGGTGSDFAKSLSPAGVNGEILAGTTDSNNFPTTRRAFNRIYNGGGCDGFVARLSSDGSELLYSTYIGGGANDCVYAIASEELGRVVLSGYTESNNFPTSEGAFDRSYNGIGDVFVAGFNADGSELRFGTYLGGRSVDYAYAISVAHTGDIIVAGKTNSDDFPVSRGAFDGSFNGGFWDAFVTRLNWDGSQLICSTYLGGQGHEAVYALDVNNGEGVDLTGSTDSDDFPTTEDAFDRSFNGGNTDAFVAKLSDDESELLYSTYLGGHGIDYANAISTDGIGEVIVAGGTSSNDMPMTGEAFSMSLHGRQDAFITQLNNDGTRLIYSTYIGGGDNDAAYALIQDGAGGVVVTGYTYSENFPTSNEAFDSSFNGGRSDLFVARLDIGLPYFLRWNEMPGIAESTEDEELIIYIRGESSDPQAALSLRYHSDDIPNANTWFNDNGDGSGSFGWDLGYNDAGRYTATFTLSDSVHEISADVAVIIHNVNLPPNHFALNQPPDHSPIPADSLVGFEWNRSTDDDRDTLTYLLKVVGSQDSLSYFARDTAIAVTRSNLLALLTSDSLRWEVWANDGTDSTRCASVFTLLPPLNASDFIPHPSSFILRAPYPNPFNGAIRLSYGIVKSGLVKLNIFDISGREVARLVDEDQAVGDHNTIWNADAYPSGVYVARLECAGQVRMTKMTLMK